MNPIRVAVVHRGNPLGPDRPGQWSYDVPEFEVVDFPQGKHFELDKDEMAETCDVIFHEAIKCYGTFEGSAPLPVCYWVCDSPLSEDHYLQRVKQMRRGKADLVLVDMDRLERFEGFGVPVRRMSYSINELIFHDYGLAKRFDVSFYGATNTARFGYIRTSLLAYLQEFCERRGYTYGFGSRLSFVEYARAMNRSKITVHIPSVIAMRSFRVLEAMASKTCLLTHAVEPVSGEAREAGEHYVEFRTQREFEDKIDWLLETGEWEGIADAGYRLIQREHLWSVRAGQLRETMLQELPALEQRVGLP